MKIFKEEILNKLNERLDEILEETGKTISACRKIVVIEFKNKGIIKDYHYTTNRSSKSDKVIYFGSCVGFDCIYKVLI